MRRCRRLIPLFNAHGQPAGRPEAVGSPGYTDPLSSVAEQPLHRALGLTDGELDAYRRAARARPEPLRARGLLAALVGALRLQALGAPAEAASRPTGKRVLQGPGENAGVLDLGDGEAVALQGREPQPPVRGRAVPGRRDRASAGSSATSSRWARGRSRCSTGCASARRRLALRPRRRRDRRLRQRGRRRRPSAARPSSTRPTPDNCLVNAMCVGLLPADRVTRAQRDRARATSSSSTARRPAATGSAARRVLASQELGEDDADKRPVRPGRRPVHGQEADRGLGRARRARARRVAAGLRRRRPRLLALRDGARRRDRRPPRPACRCARRGWSRGRS